MKFSNEEIEVFKEFKRKFSNNLNCNITNDEELLEGIFDTFLNEMKKEGCC